MNTQITIKQIIDSLPLYAQRDLKTLGMSKVYVNLEDLFDNLPDWQKQEFIENIQDTAKLYLDYDEPVVKGDEYDSIQNFVDQNRETDILDCIDNDRLIEYIEGQGFHVFEE